MTKFSTTVYAEFLKNFAELLDAADKNANIPASFRKASWGVYKKLNEDFCAALSSDDVKKSMKSLRKLTREARDVFGACRLAHNINKGAASKMNEADRDILEFLNSVIDLFEEVC